MHAAHGIGHAVGSGTGGHVIRMQRTARAAAGSDGEVLLALLDALLLVGACDRVLEAGRVRGIAGDGDIDTLVMHDGNALADVVSTVAADIGALALGVADLVDDLQLAGVVVELRLHIGEAVDAGDDLSGILAEAVQDDAQRGLARLVGVADDADGAFGGGKGLMTGQEREALGLLAQQHGAEVAVAKADLAVFGDGAVDAEGLQAFADLLGGLGGGGDTGLQRDGCADGVSPAGVLEADGLDALDDLIRIEALRLAQLAALLDGADAILRKNAVDLVDSSFVTFKQSHGALLLLFLTRVDVLRGVVELAVVTLGLLHCRGGLITLLDEVHHLAEVDEFVADDLVELVERDAGDIALGHLQIARALRLRGEHRADLAAQALAEVFHGSADGQAVLGERALGAAVDDLQEQLTHGGVDGVADEVGVQSFEDGLADEDLRSHGGGMRHAGAADGFDESFLDDAVFHVEGELAGALLRRTPADTVRKAGNVADLLRLDPLAFLRNGRRAMVCTLCNRAHMLYFSRVNHCKNPFHCLLASICIIFSVFSTG